MAMKMPKPSTLAQLGALLRQSAMNTTLLAELISGVCRPGFLPPAVLAFSDPFALLPCTVIRATMMSAEDTWLAVAQRGNFVRSPMYLLVAFRKAGCADYANLPMWYY